MFIRSRSHSRPDQQTEENTWKSNQVSLDPIQSLENIFDIFTIFGSTVALVVKIVTSNHLLCFIYSFSLKESLLLGLLSRGHSSFVPFN